MSVGNREDLDQQGYQLINDDPLGTLEAAEDFVRNIPLESIKDSVAVSMSGIGYDVYVKFGNGKIK